MTPTHADALAADLPSVGDDALARCEWIERQALADQLAAAPPRLREHAGLHVEHGPGLTAFAAPGIPSLLLNRVFLDPGADAETYAAVPGVVSELGTRGVRGMLVHAYAPAAPAQRERAASALQAAGLTPFRRAWIKLARDRRPVPALEAPLEIDLCRTEEADAFAELVIRSMSLTPAIAPLIVPLVQRPRWHVFVARDQGRLVAAGALFVQGEIGTLGLAATAPAYRGLGLQRALIARRLRVAHALGCRLASSETGAPVTGEPNPSEHNLRAMGLMPLAVRDNWTTAGSSWG